MGFDSVVEQIEKSKAFANFKKKNKDSFLCAGFFIIDYKDKKNQQQLDYCLVGGDIYTFLLDNEVIMKKSETIQGAKHDLKQLKKEMKVDLDDAEKIVCEKIKQEKIEKPLIKIIAVLQVYEGKQIWNLTCILEGFEFIQCHIDSETGDILKFERKNMMDFIQKVK
jgi:hypothetical protein